MKYKRKHVKKVYFKKYFKSFYIILAHYSKAFRLRKFQPIYLTQSNASQQQPKNVVNGLVVRFQVHIYNDKSYHINNKGNTLLQMIQSQWLIYFFLFYQHLQSCYLKYREMLIIFMLTLKHKDFQTIFLKSRCLLPSSSRRFLGCAQKSALKKSICNTITGPQ